MLRLLLPAAVLLSALVLPASGQVIYGSDSLGAITWRVTSPPGGPCLAPAPVATPCPNAALVCQGVPHLVPTPPGVLWGDITTDPTTDKVYVTDGFTFTEHAGDVACGSFGPPCFPSYTFVVPPTLPPMGPITGVGCDGSGTLTGGLPLLWITDGALLAGIVPAPPLTCNPATVLVPPCPLPPHLIPVTDVAWDPGAGLLWAVSAAGQVQALTPLTCAAAGPPVTIAACGLALPLTGLAYDTTTPNFTGAPPSAYITDGATIAYVNLLTGGPAGPTFASPTPCMPAPAPLSGLAHALHGNGYGTNQFIVELDSYGQSTSPGPSFGFDMSGAPLFFQAHGFLVVNTSFPGPGFLCPPKSGLGTKFWVDPSPPALILPLGPLPMSAGCFMLPMPIPAGIPPGIVVFAQAVFIPPGGPPAFDASKGVAITIGLR